MSADAHSPAADAAPPSGIKKQLPFIIALVGGLGAGGAGGAFFVGPAMAKGITPAVMTAAATHPKKSAKSEAADDSSSDDADDSGDGESEGGGEKGGKEGEKAAKQAYTLDNLVMNPAGSGGTRFLLLSITFETTSATLVETMKARDAELRDQVLVTLGAKTVDQLADMAGREAMKKDLAAAVAKLFHKKGGIQVYFPQFVIQ